MCVTQPSYHSARLHIDTYALQLGLQSAPVVLSYTPTKGPRASAKPRTEPITYDFNNKYVSDA